MITAHSFRTDIEAFLKRSGMSATAFGKAVVSDPNFVHEVREGRMPSLRLVEKVQTYIHSEDEPAPSEQESAA